MNKLKGNLAAKIIAIILLATSCLVICGVIVGVTWLESVGAYRGKSINSVRAALIDNRLQSICFELLDRMRVYPVSSAYDSTVRFELLDENESVLAGNLSDKELVEHACIMQVDGYYGGMYFTAEDKPLTTRGGLSWDYDPNSGLRIMPEAAPSSIPVPTVTPVPTPVPWDGIVEQASESPVPDGKKVWTMRLYWTETSGSLQTDMELRTCEMLYPLRYTLIIIGAISFVLAVLLFVFLLL